MQTALLRLQSLDRVVCGGCRTLASADGDGSCCMAATNAGSVSRGRLAPVRPQPETRLLATYAGRSDWKRNGGRLSGAVAQKPLRLPWPPHWIRV